MRLALGIAALLVMSPWAGDAARKPKPGPINTKLTVDQTRAAKATITSAAGGVLTVTARNGTKIVITFPAGAVVEDTLVTAAPVTKVDSRYTKTGLIGGVQLQPEGLQLAKPANVRFARRGKAPKGTRMYFAGSLGNGRDFYRLPPPMRSTGTGKKRKLIPTGAPVVTIDHFSTGLAFDWSTATVSQIDAINRPAVGTHQMSQEIAKALKQGDVEAALEIMQRYRKTLIEPVVAVALNGLRSNCSARSISRARTAIQLVFAFDRQLQLLGGEGIDANTVELMREAGNCLTKLCTQLGDPRAGPFLLGLARQLQLAGSGFSEAFFNALQENARRCGVYEVRIDSRIDNKGEDLDYSLRVRGAAKVKPLTREPPRAPLTYVSATGSAPSFCVITNPSGTKDGEFEVTQSDLGTFDPERPSNDRVVQVTLAFPVIPQETYTSTPTGAENCGTDAPPPRDFSLWYFGFQAHHLGFILPGSDWLPDNPPVFAAATYPGRVLVTPLGNGSSTENTRVEIVHTPEDPVPLPDPLPPK